MSLTQIAEALFRKALAEVSIPARVAAHVRCDADWLRIDEQEYPLGNDRRIGVVAIGKAALSMSDAFVRILTSSPAALAKLRGVVVSGVAPNHKHPAFTYFIGGHPVPTPGSLQAADAILSMLSEFGPSDLVIYLISGGASAMVERALDPRLSFEDTVELYRALLHSGLPIAEMNCVRKHLSAAKGGRLAVAANGATQVSLLVSDVSGDDLSVIGSGPSLPDPSTVDDCRRVLDKLLAPSEISSALRELIRSVQLEETPKPNDPSFARSFSTCIVSPPDLLQAAGALAAEAGFHVEIDNTCDEWDYIDAANYLLTRVRQLRMQHRRVCLLSGGELSVRLPRQAGLGGRNQQFALACALRLGDNKEHTAVLSAGSDGIDGNSPAAGAFVDEQTCSLALGLGIEPRIYYDRFDSYSFFRMLGAAIVTGPTENNLRDLRILLSDA